jgi:hypothetical protein
MTYQGEVYREQGGDKFVVGSTGTIEINGTLSSTGTASFRTISASGAVSLSGLLSIANETVNGNSTGTASALASHGLSVISSSASTGARALFSLPAPDEAGVLKAIFASHASTATCVVSCTAATIGSTKSTLTFDADDEAVMLVSGASAWYLVGNVGSVASA